MPERLRDKVAVITGSSSGLGRATALLYAAEGAFVVCADLQRGPRVAAVSGKQEEGEGEEKATDVLIERGWPGRVRWCRTDVRVPEEVEGLVRFAVAEFGRLDVMVNNAGISVEARIPGPVHTCSIETFDLTMSVNARSVFLGSKYAAAQMLKQKPHASGDRGWIVNVSSIYGLVGTKDAPAYCASKGAVSNLTRAMAVDYFKDNIHVNAICPGHVETAIFAETTQNMVDMETMKGMYPFKGPGKPEDIARMAVVLASEDASWMTGACVSVDGGYVAR